MLTPSEKNRSPQGVSRKKAAPSFLTRQRSPQAGSSRAKGRPSSFLPPGEGAGAGGAAWRGAAAGGGEAGAAARSARTASVAPSPQGSEGGAASLTPALSRRRERESAGAAARAGPVAPSPQPSPRGG